MNLNPITGRAKWCALCIGALACCAQALSNPKQTSPAEDTTLLLATVNTKQLKLTMQRAEDARLALEHSGKRALPARGDTHFLVVNAGFVGIFNRFAETLRYGAEFRWREMGVLKLRPSAGIINAENDASYYFLGLRRDFALSEHIILSGSFDAGYFEERDELQLGLQMEFRSGAELSYRFDNEYRIGLALYHLSNGGFGDRNPGTEAVVLSLIAPIR